ncbi:choline transporter-like protein 2 [Entelurus aequoreus]|uniref:choline transporter-like protein 2 n=1 Tax=Entelurus aequoreus TaxID=161455 RepID=UPI002B1DEA2A|nr:choline transporter-like protein 2 [Entelurus aequoreus]
MEQEEKNADSKYGETRTFDPNFKGPIHQRGCTDVLCCVLFIVALIGYMVVGIIAWSHGDPKQVIYPTDSNGHFCGQAGTPMEKKPLLFYFNILKCASPLVLLEFQCPTTQVCVESCPHKHMTLNNALKNRDDKQYYQQFCKEGVDLSKETDILAILTSNLCPAMLMPSRPFTGRCLPDLAMKGDTVMVGDKTNITDNDGLQIQAKVVLEASKKSNMVVEARVVAMKIFEDYSMSWHWIMLGLVIAMVLSFTFIVLLRYLAGIMVWVIIILVIVVISYGIIHCNLEYRSLKGTTGENTTIRDLGLQTDFTVYLKIRQTWLGFMITLIIVEVTIILLLIFLRKRIFVAVALIKEASRAVGHLSSSIFFPLLTFSLITVVIAYWIVTSVFLSTSNEQVYKVFNKSDCEFSRTVCDPKTFNTSEAYKKCPDAECLFAFYGGDTPYHKYLIVFQFYNLFLFFWCANFVCALGQVTLAGAFASYYWAFKKPEDIPAFPIFSSLGRVLRYHTGSVAFGALILSVVQIIRIFLEYVDKKLKNAENKAAKFLLNCMKVCFWCLEKCIKFMNRNAYIMLAIYGKSFCTSAKDAFFLLMRNLMRVAVLDKVTDFLLFLGTLLVVGIVGICSFFFFSGKIKSAEYAAPSLHYYWVPILTVIVGAYLIAQGFFSVYAMCVDTFFLCFCEDLERNDGSVERPYFMSAELHEILSKVKKVEPDGQPVSPEDVQIEKGTSEQELAGAIQLRQQSALHQVKTPQLGNEREETEEQTFSQGENEEEERNEVAQEQEEEPGISKEK